MTTTLFQHEFKKMTRKKSFIIAALCLMVCITLLSVLFIKEASYSDEAGNIMTGPAAISLNKAQTKELAGPLTTEKLAAVLTHYQSVINDPQNYETLGAEGQSIKNEVYGQQIKKYEDVLDLVRRDFSPVGTYDYYVLSSVQPEDMANFYEKRTANVQELLNMDYSTGNYTDAEKDYFLNLNSQIKTPFYFAYTQGWYDMFTRGFLSIMLMAALVTCISVSQVFANEYQTGADSIILSSRFGKNKIIAAKVAASVVFTTVIYAASMLYFTGIMLAFHGVSGWDTPFQLASFNSPYPFTMLQVYLYGLAIGYIVTLSIMAIVLLFSAVNKTSFSVVIIGALYIFVPMFLPSSKTGSLINGLVALLPAKAMDIFSVFSVYSCYNIAGQIISLPLAILLFSACIIVLAIPLACVKFKKHQVG
jgi:hypothetical protein